MTAAEMLSVVSQHHISLRVEDGRLRYHAPTGALTPELRRLLAEHKDILIAHLDGRGADAAGICPLSYSQQFLWFLYHLAPQSSAYNVAFVARIASPVDFDRMRAAFQRLVDRHPILRTTYESVGGVPCMKMHSRLDLACERIDVSGHPEEQLGHAVRQKYAEPFDLARGPVLRVQLFTRTAEDHVLLLTVHHIACDGGSIGVLVREFCDFYAAAPAAAPLPAAPSYADYVRYQGEVLRGPEGERLRAFWTKQLAGELAEINLPIDKPRGPTRVPRGSTLHFSIKGDLYRDLVALARGSGATLYSCLLASLQTLLMRYSAQEDILIGTPMASRPRKEDESTVGCFINPVVLRGAVSADLTFQELLRRTRRTATEALENRHYPFSLLVEQLAPSRDASRSPVFQVMFNLLNRQSLGLVADLLYRDSAEAALAESIDVAGLKMRPFPMDQEEGQFDLALEMIDNGQTLTGLLKYSTELFEASTIARMAQHLEVLLQGIVADSSRRLGDLPILPDSERHTLLVEWNRTAADYPQDACLHELFQEQARRTPEAPAVVFEGASLTYRELDRRANALAHRLKCLGAGPDVPIGVHLERSLDMVTALYAILKAGSAYVPLDPEYPKERLAFMIGEMNGPVVLTQRSRQGELPPCSARILCLDALEPAPADQDAGADAPPDSGVQPDHLAYVIYTSGSTGRPKGVMNTHRGICNRLRWMQDTYRLTVKDVVLQKTPFSFDVSVWEFFWPLLAGARLVVARPGGHRDSAYLVRTILEHGVTVLHFVPSMLQVFLEEKNAASCQCLRHVICSGEALPYELQERFFSVFGAELHNLYGPTEAAVDVTYWACRRGDARRVVPIGRPVANTQIYILDARMQPVPIGIPGELHIGGVQVARGYLNRPDLTAERFVADPFCGVPGARLYKTGDLCRYLPDGSIDYLGRNDFQVKIRGMRIELGEIEAAMRQYPGVREAVVTVREDRPGDRRLVGYFVSASASTAAQTDPFRAFLKSRLADYMVPASLVQLAAFPLTSSGKVDRRALPAPATVCPAEKAGMAPRGEAERRVVGIWQELLRLDAVGVEDNFFDLGGHSLLLVRLAARLRESFGRDVSLVDLFQRPTAEGQAALMAGADTRDPSLLDAQTRAMRQRAALHRQTRSINMREATDVRNL